MDATKVLVVEDNTEIAEYLRRLLVACGYTVVVAHTSQEGISAAREHEPDVVLCDIGLPDADGYVVGSVLRQLSQRKHARLIAVTGHSGPQNRLRALAAGFDQHLTKPVDPKELLREIQVPAPVGQAPSHMLG